MSTHKVNNLYSAFTGPEVSCPDWVLRLVLTLAAFLQQVGGTVFFSLLLTGPVLKSQKDTWHNLWRPLHQEYYQKHFQPSICIELHFYKWAHYFFLEKKQNKPSKKDFIGVECRIFEKFLNWLDLCICVIVCIFVNNEYLMTSWDITNGTVGPNLIRNVHFIQKTKWIVTKQTQANSSDPVVQSYSSWSQP